MDKSIELLEHQLNIEMGTLILPHRNRQTLDSVPEPDDKAFEYLESLTQMDLWLYNYAKSVFNARYLHYKTGVWNQPSRPPTIGKVKTINKR